MEGVGVHALDDWKNDFFLIVDNGIENITTHPQLYKQPPSRFESTERKITQ